MSIRFEYVPGFAPRRVLQMEFSALFDQGLKVRLCENAWLEKN